MTRMPETLAHDLPGDIHSFRLITFAQCQDHGWVWDHRDIDQQHIDACYTNGCRIQASWWPNDLDGVDMSQVVKMAGDLYTNRDG